MSTKDTLGMVRKITISIGEFIDRHSILAIKEKHGLDVGTEIEQYEGLRPGGPQYEMFFKILYSINSQLWKLEDVKRNGVERWSQKESDTSFMITSLNDLRYETKKRVDEFYQSEISEKKSH